MSDDPLDPARGELERKLDAFYRGLDESARRVEGRWKLRARGPWILAATAAAAALLVGVWLLRLQPAPPAPTIDVARPAPRPAPPASTPMRVPERPRPQEPNVVERQAPVPRPPDRPPDPPARPEPPKPEEPRPAPLPAPEEPRKPEPKRTVVERAMATIREVEGTFDFAEKPLRGRQKDFTVAAGDRLKAATVVKLTLADDRFILLSPRSVVEFRPEEKRLTIAIDLGDLHAELIGPGPEIRVATRNCEAQPLGTVFTVRAEEKRSTVVVERGRVEVKGARGRSTARAGESILATEDGTVLAPVPADFRTLAWVKPHRPPESAVFFEDFLKPGAWKAELAGGAAKGLAAPGAAAVIHLESEKPIFEVPVRGQVQVVCRADRASKMYVQFFARDLRTNYRKEVSVLRGTAWRTLTLDIDEFLPFDKSKPQGRAPAGAAVTDFGLYYGEEGEKGSFWVDSVRVIEVRP